MARMLKKQSIVLKNHKSNIQIMIAYKDITNDEKPKNIAKHKVSTQMMPMSADECNKLESE